MRRGFGLFLAVGLVGPLVVAATASAQGSTLQLTPPTASPGQLITATGAGYSTGAGVSDVSIRLSTRSGEPLREVVPDARGNISTTFRLPEVSPGWYLVLATQTTANGRTRAFTPGRTRLLVQAASGAAPSAASDGATGGTWPSAGWFGILALMLLAAGLALAARRLRTSDRPQLGS